MRYFCLFIAVFFITSFSSAQDVRFKHISKEDGLSQSRVNAILQDKDGFLWLGTDDGLNRYDGLKFTVFKNNVNNTSTISDNWITCLFEDEEGTIWIGTSEGGLNKYDKLTGSFISYTTSNNRNSISSNTVTAIIQKDKGHLWVATNDGLNLFSISERKFTRYKDEDISSRLSNTLSNDAIKTLFQDRKGVLWIGTDKNGLMSWDPKTQKFKSWLETNEDKSPRVPYSERVRAIFEDKRDRLWIGFQGASVAVLDRETGQMEFKVFDAKSKNSVASNVIQSIIEDHQGLIWVATDNGISIYNESTETFKNYRKAADDLFSLPDNHVRVIYEDRAHSIWCGTEASGIAVYHRSLGKFNHVFSKDTDDKAPLSNTIFAFEEGEQEDIWIATIGEGISRISRKDFSVEHFNREKNKTHNNILCLAKSEGVLWFGSWGGGLGSYNFTEKKFNEPKIAADQRGLSNNTIIDIQEDYQGNLWLATFNGLNYYDINKDTFYVYNKTTGFPFSVVYSLCLDGDYLWVGTKGDGLIRFSVKDQKTKVFKKDPSIHQTLSDNTIHAVLKDDKYLWLSTKNGLSRFEITSGKCKNYYETDGLSSNFILGVIKDRQKNLWISTNNGITRFNPEQRKGKRFETRTYYAIDGLQSDEFNQNAFYQATDGEMFFGGVNGFNHFYPEKIVDNSYKPPVFITSFKIFGKEFQLDTSIFFTKYIELDYRQNFISFEFAALDYLLPEKNLYSYKMEGLDEYWSEPSARNYVSYSDLAGGDYTFIVKASNNDGVWNDTGIRIHIRVIPPFYKTKWFYSVCAFVLIILIFVFIRLRIAGIRREKEILEEKVAERTRELAEKNNDIMSSIEYAKRIQLAILPERKVIFTHFPDAFIYYQPKDIVSGDFYWFGVVGNKKIIAVVDCTGHGVPGAFMSMIGHSLLNQLILENKMTDPADILYHLNDLVKLALKQENKEEDTRDGMDVALCVVDMETAELTFAGAFRPLYIVKSNSLEKIEGDKVPIGGAYSGEAKFTNYHRKLHKGDSFFIHSDGLVDQFGGPKGKKFMGKQLQSLIVENHHLSMPEYEALIIDKFTEWMGNMEQVDDVLIIGIRY